LEYFLIARIEQLYGKDGYFKIKSFSDFPERFLNLKKVYIDFWGDKKSFCIEDVRNIRGKILIKFERFDNTRECELLIGRDVYVEENDVVSLPDNHFFMHDLIGSEVFISNNKLGIVTDVIKGKANDVLVISVEDNKEKLIPLVLNFIEEFNVAKKRLILNISEGFLKDDED
jgi:16S rRNA processing protein RimM